MSEQDSLNRIAQDMDTIYQRMRKLAEEAKPPQTISTPAERVNGKLLECLRDALHYIHGAEGFRARCEVAIEEAEASL